MKRRIGWLALLALCCAMLCAAHADEDALLYLTFDEGTGAMVSDASGHWPEKDVEYQYLHAAFADDMEPEWRDTGVVNGALTMEVFIDRSLVEAFFNDDKSVSVRAYGKAASRGLSLFAEGEVAVEGLEVFSVQSIYAE